MNESQDAKAAVQVPGKEEREQDYRWLVDRSTLNSSKIALKYIAALAHVEAERDRCHAAGEKIMKAVKPFPNEFVHEAASRVAKERDRLADAIRTHRAQKADDRCIEDDDRLYEVLGDGIKCDRRVGDKTAMLLNCARFIERRCEVGGWPSYAELEAELEKVKGERDGAVGLIRRLTDGMKWWADQEDGIPDECWEAYTDAKLLLTGKRPTAEAKS